MAHPIAFIAKGWAFLTVLTASAARTIPPTPHDSDA